MIKVSISNYTTLKSAQFDINGLTVLRAASNGGKSSTVNAIYAAVTAEYPPSALRWGESKSQIMLQFVDGVVQLTRAGGSSSYQISTAGGLNQQYSKFGRKLPGEVNQFLNLCTINVADSPYLMNFHQQFAPPLSLAMSHNRFVSLLSASDLLEDHKGVSKKLSTKAYELQGSITSFSKLLVTTQDTLLAKQGQLVYINQLAEFLDVKFRELQTLNTSVSAISSLSDKLALLKFSIVRHQALEALLLVLDKVLHFKARLDSLLVISNKLSSLEVIKQRLGYSTVLTKKVTSLLESVVVLDKARVCQQSVVSVGGMIDVVSKSELLSRSKTEMYHKLDTLVSAVSGVDSVKSRVNRLSLLSTSLTQLKSLELSYKAKSKVLDDNLCPVCNSSLDAHKH